MSVSSLLMIKALHMVISGRVQGVGFRYFVYHQAHENGITGYVRNLPSGNVEVLANGESGSLERFKEILAIGPPSALVRDISEEWIHVDELPINFEVRY